MQIKAIRNTVANRKCIISLSAKIFRYTLCILYNTVRKRKRENAHVCVYGIERGRFENNGLMSSSRMIDGRVVLYV